MGSIPGLERSPRRRDGTPPQYSCLENSMDRGAWWAIVHGVAKGSDTTERARAHTHTHTHVYIKQNHFAVHPKLTHCESIVLQQKKILKCINWSNYYNEKIRHQKWFTQVMSRDSYTCHDIYNNQNEYQQIKASLTCPYHFRKVVGLTLLIINQILLSNALHGTFVFTLFPCSDSTHTPPRPRHHIGNISTKRGLYLKRIFGKF